MLIRQKGLTLIELVLVIGLIALLIAMMTAGLQSARQKAKDVLCLSQVDQLVLGLVSYEIDCQSFPFAFFDQASPSPVTPPGGYVGNPAYDRQGWWWFHYLSDYMAHDFSGDSVIRCPARCISNTGGKENPLCGNYGVNRSICKTARGRQSEEEFWGKPLSATQISHPGQTLLVADCGYSMISWWQVADIPPVPLGHNREGLAYIPGLSINQGKTVWPGQESDARQGRHSHKTVNVGFADGHVERLPADELAVEAMEDDYRNLTPLWRP